MDHWEQRNKDDGGPPPTNPAVQVHGIGLAPQLGAGRHGDR